MQNALVPVDQPLDLLILLILGHFLVDFPNVELSIAVKIGDCCRCCFEFIVGGLYHFVVVVGVSLIFNTCRYFKAYFVKFRAVFGMHKEVLPLQGVEVLQLCLGFDTFCFGDQRHEFGKCQE